MKATELTENISKALGIQSLNPMQQQMLKSKSPRIILTAPTGSGKTLAFTIRMLRNLKAPCAKVQAVVIAPSRELVIQIASVVRPVARGYKTVALYGGHSMADETNSLSPLPDIIIATPGRLLDHLQRSNIEINSVNTLVLDEYDKSLELGFEGEMRKIVRRIGR
ncbi:MAG: DEAD/DEAH box helicase, partial [Barnesiella sp.]|nr:DEAD/DEAH box helicase [Barnesiella sp.]